MKTKNGLFLLGTIILACYSCKEIDQDANQCEKYCEKTMYCWEAEYKKFFEQQGGTWNKVEWLRGCNDNCPSSEQSEELINCYLTHECGEITKACEPFFPDGGVNPYEGDVCYRGIIVNGDVTGTSYDDVQGEVLTNVEVQLGDGNQVNTYMKTQENGLYGEGSGFPAFCSPVNYKTMIITFTHPGCEQAKYETDLSSMIDIKAPGDGKNIVLNAVLKCWAL